MLRVVIVLIAIVVAFYFFKVLAPVRWELGDYFGALVISFIGALAEFTLGWLFTRVGRS